MANTRCQGIVLTNGQPMEGMTYHMALVFDQSYRYVRQFRMIPVENLVVKSKHRPTEHNQERMVRVIEESPLIYGDSISWDRYDQGGRNVELVRDYQKIQQIYPSRLFDGESQLLLQGIMSKNRKVLWMCDMWPDLEIPYRIQKDAHPNVTVNAWVTVHILPNHSLKYELHSFKEPADSFQFLVRKAEWNEEGDGNIPIMHDPVAERREVTDLMPTLADTVTGMHGIVISKKIVMAVEERHQDYCFHRIVCNEDDRFPGVGSYVRFNAEKLEFLNIYALKEVIQLNDGRQLPLTKNGLAQITIRQVPDLPGFFHSKMLGCYLDDPENILEAWLLCPYSKSTLQVGITAAEPSVKGTPRYVIAEITDKKLEKIEQFRMDGGAKIQDEPAIVMDFMGRIHLNRLPKSNFRLSPADRILYPPGTKLFITAMLTGTKWIIESIEINKRDPFVPALIVREDMTRQDTIWFNVNRARGCKELPFLLSTDNFGLIQTPKVFKIHKAQDHYTYDDVWVTINDCHPGECIKPPAKFKYAGIGNVEGFSRRIEPVEVESSIPDYPDLSSDLDESFSRETALNDANIPTVYHAMADDHFQENYWLSVRKMVQELERNPKWRSTPLKLIDTQITEHLFSCRFCSENQFNENCYFGEYLAEVIQMNPQVTQILSPDILSIITTRRFTK